MDDVTIRLESFDQGRPGMCGVGVIDHDLLRRTCDGEIDDLLVSCVCREIEAIDLDIDGVTMSEDRDGSRFQQAATTRILGLVTCEEEGVPVIMTKTIEIPQCGASVQHPRGRDDHISIQGSLAIRACAHALRPLESCLEPIGIA